MNRTPIVEFRGVTKRFGSTEAVRDVSLAIAPGEFFSLLGPSGCGKSTTLRLLAGFELPDAGEVLLSGEVVNQRRPYQRNLGMVFQHYALFPHLSVAQNVAFGLEQRKRPPAEVRDRVHRALELVRLDAATFATRTPGSLSGGQKQRVALARALVLEPPVLLLDEPLGALDLKLRKAMQAELKELNRTLGTTFVYVTHDQEEALAMSDRIAVMSGGQVAQVGTPAQVYEEPHTRFVAQFIGEANIIRRRTNGTAVEMALRPERLVLVAPGSVPPGHDAVEGVVEDVVYLGEAMHVRVRTREGDVITAAVRNEGQLQRPLPWARGAPCAACWRANDGQALEG